jgi:hypothetical protein
MRMVALRLWDRLRSGGATEDGAAKQVGIPAVTLRLWRESGGRKWLLPVQLIPEAKPAVRLVSPGGYRIELPDVATAAALLRELG